jgi:Sec-independent protein secretion pathway component TatC
MTAAAQNLLSLKLAASLGIVIASPWQAIQLLHSVERPIACEIKALPGLFNPLAAPIH